MYLTTCLTLTPIPSGIYVTILQYILVHTYIHITTHKKVTSNDIFTTPAIPFNSIISTSSLVCPLVSEPPDKTAYFPRGPPRRHRQWRQIHHAITLTTGTSDNGGPTLQYPFLPYRGPQAHHTEGAQSLHMHCIMTTAGVQEHPGYSADATAS